MPVNKSEAQLPDEEKKHRLGLKWGITGAASTQQTAEEMEEYDRYRTSLGHMRNELGPTNQTGKTAAAQDSNGDTVMEDLQNPRNNNVYIFQLPTLMPQLTSAIKKEPMDVETQPIEDSNAADAPVEVKNETTENASNLFRGLGHCTSGRLGRLRVRESGRTTLEWGGVVFELKPGRQPTFLQEIVAMKKQKHDAEGSPQRPHNVEDEGEVLSMGRVKGKFVATPQWSLGL